MLLIIAIGWLYVVLMMALTQPSVLAGLATLFFYGLFPLSVVLYLVATPARRRRRQAIEARQTPDSDQDDRA